MARPPFGNDMELGTIMFIISIVICALGFAAGFVMYYRQSTAQQGRDEERIVRGKARRAASFDASMLGDESAGGDYLLTNIGAGGAAAASTSVHSNLRSANNNNGDPRGIGSYIDSAYSSLPPPAQQQHQQQQHSASGGLPLPQQPPPRRPGLLPPIDLDDLDSAPNSHAVGLGGQAYAAADGHPQRAQSTFQGLPMRGGGRGADPLISYSPTDRNSMEDDLLGSPAGALLGPGGGQGSYGAYGAPQQQASLAWSSTVVIPPRAFAQQEDDPML